MKVEGWLIVKSPHCSGRELGSQCPYQLTRNNLTPFPGCSMSFSGFHRYLRTHSTHKFLLAFLGFLLLSWNPMTKATWEGMVLFGLYIHIIVYHQKQVRTRTQTGQEPEGRSWCRSHRGMLLTDSLLMACSACFVIEPRTNRPGWRHPWWLNFPTSIS